MNISKAFIGAACLTFALLPTVARAQFNLQPTLVDLVDSCKKGLVTWLPLPPIPKCGYVQVPQVKIFDSVGQLRFAGSALDSFKWANSGLPTTKIPEGITVRDSASESRIVHVAAPLPGISWVAFYVTKNCAPCLKQLETFRSDVMPKLGPGASLSVFNLDAPGD